MVLNVQFLLVSCYGEKEKGIVVVLLLRVVVVVVVLLLLLTG